MQLSASDFVPILREIDRVSTTNSGIAAFPERTWLALDQDPQRCVVGVAADRSIGIVAYPSDTFQSSHLELAVAIAPGPTETGPTETGPTETVARSVLTTVLDRLEPGIPVVAWVPGSDPRITEVLRSGGFTIDREQFQMRVPLPLADAAVWPAGVAVRAFRPGRDDAAWLRVNNRAFANHPDQGGWIQDALKRRLAEEWFDAAGFLLATRGDAVIGFCWTKVHPRALGEPESLGEIFVIGVDPDAQGLGLGRALVMAGLDHLASVRQCRIGLLYVAATNTPAVALYRGLGFSLHRTDTALVLNRGTP